MSTTFDVLKNKVSSQVRTPYAPADGVIQVVDASGFDNQCRVVCYTPGSGPFTEIVKMIVPVVGVDTGTNVLTIGSPIEGSTDTALSTLDRVEIRFTAGHYSDVATAVNTLEAGGGGGSGTVTNVSGATSSGFEVSVSEQTTTPVIAVSCTLASGIIKSDGAGGIVHATAGTDYLATYPVTSVAGHTGVVTLAESDISGLVADLALKAPLASPALTGTPTCPTATGTSNDTTIASTAFVKVQGYLTSNAVSSVAGRTGAVVIAESDVGSLVTDLAAKAPLASPTFTGTPLSTTPSTADSSTKIATTAYVQAQSYVTAATAPVVSVATRTGAITLAVADITGAAPLASPTLTGTPLSTTPSVGDSSTKIATTAYVQGCAFAPRGPFKSGLYYAIVPGATTTTALTANTFRAYPFWCSYAMTLTRLAAEITSIGDAGSKVRLGIYADTGSGYPGSLLLDAGVIAGDSATVQEITISQALTANTLYWFGAVSQVITTTNPTLRTIANIAVDCGSSSLPGTNMFFTGYQQTGVSGALPSPFSVTVAVGSSAPTRIYMKIA